MTSFFFPLDVDECRTTCMKDTQQCINSQGSYNCKCKAGYEKKNGAADDECTKGKSLSFVGLTVLVLWTYINENLIKFYLLPTGLKKDIKLNVLVVLTALKNESNKNSLFLTHFRH